MNITFYQFSKRTNSTKIVDVSGTTLVCELKGTTTIFNPSLVIKAVPAAWNPIWNYCYIPEFSRYYFIDNWTWLNGVWECSLVCDVLASFKTDIGNLSEYVLRSSYEADGNITDDAYIAKAQSQTHMTMLPEFFVRVMTGGFYIVGIIGKESTATQGAITYYQMDASEMARLRAYLLSDTFLTDQGLVNLANFIPADATKVIYNPYQYIVSCMWFPLPMNAIDAAWKTSVSSIDFGWWNTGTGFSGYRLDSNVPYYTHGELISLSSHPQITRGEYINHSPYTSRVLRLSPFNEIQLPDAYFDTGDKLYIELQVEFISGMGNLIVQARNASNQTRMLITRLTQKIGVDIQLAQVGSDYFGAYSQNLSDTNYQWDHSWGQLSNVDLSSLAGAAKSGFNIGANFAKADAYKTAAMGNYLKAKAPQLLTAGSNGSMLSLAQNNYLCETFYIAVDDDPAQLGKPLCKVRTLNTIPGYILVMTPDVSLPCFEVERTLISEFLTTGFFYE